MSRESELFADCLANPDEDAPRLVWADHVGGERGELVVVQCDLARGELTGDERRLRLEREAELLSQHAIEWAGDIPRHALRWSYRRGFVEAVKVDSLQQLDARALRSLAPIRGLTIKPLLDMRVTPAEIEPLRGIAALCFLDNPPAEQLADLAPTLASFGLRALAIDNLAANGVEPVIHILEQSPIERLRFRHLRITPPELEQILGAAPALRALDLEPSPLAEGPGEEPRSRRATIEAAAKFPLRALRLGPVSAEDIAPLAGSVAATTLERLGYEPLGVVAIAPALPALRVLAVPPAKELIHPAADALLDLGPSWFLVAPAFWVVRLDRPEIFEIPSRPADHEVHIGRSQNVEIRIQSGTVARRHTRLYWKHDHHVAKDLGSTNGMVIDGDRVDQVPLRDGDTLTLGVAVIRYFIGPGAEQRARAASLLGS